MKHVWNMQTIFWICYQKVNRVVHYSYFWLTIGNCYLDFKNIHFKMFSSLGMIISCISTDWIIFVLGGHTEFHRKHKDLCEDTLVSGLSSRSLPSSPCPASDIDSHPASRVLPFLYLGNSKNAADLSCLQDLGTTCVLNVTPQLGGYHETCGITYKQIPATDNGHQNLKQYFEEAFEFIGKSNRHSKLHNKLVY